MQKNAVQYMNSEQYISLFEEYGETDVEYLHVHYPRFCETQRLFKEFNPTLSGLRVLDMGAHWLHQAVLYSQDGCKVTAADFAGTLDRKSIKRLASNYDIELFIYNDISTAEDFDSFPDDSFDLILFTEMIEHITFNPVELWKSIYRILAPNGKILVTTPNYYYFRRTIRDFLRMFTRMGGGIPVQDILYIHTFGHHWKEYSAKELCHYFGALSADFHISRVLYMNTATQTPTILKAMIAKLVPILFRPTLYLEIELIAKNTGIQIDPYWSRKSNPDQPN
jgi:2-polyprenyl-6-hydroxyphenyl methylase/3-demethylubiquinone-9 3-methyltransferase